MLSSGLRILTNAKTDETTPDLQIVEMEKTRAGVKTPQGNGLTLMEVQ